MNGARDRDWTGAAGSAADAARLAAYYDLWLEPRLADGGDIEWTRALASRVGGPILELGCGTGRVAVPLARDGHAVTGVDFSASMLERARARAAAADVALDLVEGDIREVQLGRTYALVLIVLNTFLQLDPADRLRSLDRVRAHLSLEGRFAMHVFQPDPARIASRDRGVVEEGRFTDPASGREVSMFSSASATVDRTTVTWRYDEVGEDHIVRRYERTATLHYVYRRELELLLSAAGFEIESLHGDFDGSPADERSPHLLVVARRSDRGEGRDRRGA